MLNNSSSEDSSSDGIYLKLPFGFIIFQLILQTAIGLFGVIGNVIVCAKIIMGTKALSATMSPYLLSLAFADLGILLFNYPLVILHIQFPYEWLLGRIACLYIGPFTETFFGACIWSITAIAAERYVNIAWKIVVPIPESGRTPPLKRRIRFIVIAIWVTAFFMASLPIYLYRKYDSAVRPPQCYNEFTHTFHRTLTTINAILMYVLPLSIIAFSYQRIGKKVSKRLKELQYAAPNPCIGSSLNAKTILHQTRKTQRILKPLVILFTSTMLPYQMFNLATVYWGETYRFVYQSYHNILLVVVATSIGINSAADPLVYCVVNKDFRQEIKAVLLCCFRAHSRKWALKSSFSVRDRQSRTTTIDTYIKSQRETAL